MDAGSTDRDHADSSSRHFRTFQFRCLPPCHLRNEALVALNGFMSSVDNSLALLDSKG